MQKNIFKSTSTNPVRIAVLGGPECGKSSIVSIIANNLSLDNYYPTLRNSPILLQFQPKRRESRAVLDVNVTLDDLLQVGVWTEGNNGEIILSDKLLNIINKRGIELLKEGSINNKHDSKKILELTNGNYDLDYTQPYIFDDDRFSPLSSFHSPKGIATFSRGHSFGHSFGNSAGRSFPGGISDNLFMTNNNNNNNNDEEDDELRYLPPISTPVLIELVDTPGVSSDDIIPFLERSVDSRLSKDVLSNLANEYNTSFRSRILTLITASGISDLNAAVDAYILCYNCQNLESLEVAKSLYNAINDAWKEWDKYEEGWKHGGEYDVHSVSSSIKQLWKREHNSNNNSNNSHSHDHKNGKFMPSFPPIVLVATHTDNGNKEAIDKGKKLAHKWGASFTTVVSGGECEEWKNVEETIAIAIRASIQCK